MSRRTKSFRLGNFMFIEATIWLLGMIWLFSGKFASDIERYWLSRNTTEIDHMANNGWFNGTPKLLVVIIVPIIVATMVFTMTKKNKAHFLVTFVATRWSFLIMLALTLSLAF